MEAIKANSPANVSAAEKTVSLSLAITLSVFSFISAFILTIHQHVKLKLFFSNPAVLLNHLTAVSEYIAEAFGGSLAAILVT